MRACEPEKRRFWEEHLKNWELSGQSQVEYCRKNGINIKSFHYWKRKIGRSYCAPAMVELPISWSVPVIFQSMWESRLVNFFYGTRNLLITNHNLRASRTPHQYVSYGNDPI